MERKLVVSIVEPIEFNSSTEKSIRVCETPVPPASNFVRVFSCDKKYLWKAIAFSRSDESNKLLTDTVASLRIVRDSTTDTQALGIINEQINSITKFLDAVEEEYHSLKILLTK